MVGLQAIGLVQQPGALAPRGDLLPVTGGGDRGGGISGDAQAAVAAVHAVVAQAGEQFPVLGDLDQVLGIKAKGPGLEVAGAALRAADTVFFSSVKSAPASSSCWRPRAWNLLLKSLCSCTLFSSWIFRCVRRSSRVAGPKFSSVAARPPGCRLACANRMAPARWSRSKWPTRSWVLSSAWPSKRWVWPSVARLALPAL